jgi:hypothetical protein
MLANLFFHSLTLSSPLPPTLNSREALWSWQGLLALGSLQEVNRVLAHLPFLKAHITYDVAAGDTSIDLEVGTLLQPSKFLYSAASHIVREPLTVM